MKKQFSLPMVKISKFDITDWHKTPQTKQHIVLELYLISKKLNEIIERINKDDK